MKITKDVLRKLNAHAGQFDTDSDMVFDGFVGKIEMPSKAYVGEPTYSEPGEDPPEQRFSLSEITNPKEPDYGDPQTYDRD